MHCVLNKIRIFENCWKLPTLIRDSYFEKDSRLKNDTSMYCITFDPLWRYAQDFWYKLYLLVWKVQHNVIVHTNISWFCRFFWQFFRLVSEPFEGSEIPLYSIEPFFSPIPRCSFMLRWKHLQSFRFWKTFFKLLHNYTDPKTFRSRNYLKAGRWSIVTRIDGLLWTFLPEEGCQNISASQGWSIQLPVELLISV